MGVAITYPLSIAAKAAQISSRKQRRLIDTGITPLRGNDVKPGGSGNYCGLSRARILQSATTEALWKAGVSLSTAAKAALVFSDYGNTGRAPGECFGVGKTILLVSREGATVINTFSSTSFSDVSAGSACIIAVDLNNVVERVDAVLNLNIHRKH